MGRTIVLLGMFKSKKDKIQVKCLIVSCTTTLLFLAPCSVIRSCTSGVRLDNFLLFDTESNCDRTFVSYKIFICNLGRGYRCWNRMS